MNSNSSPYLQFKYQHTAQPSHLNTTSNNNSGMNTLMQYPQHQPQQHTVQNISPAIQQNGYPQFQQTGYQQLYQPSYTNTDISSMSFPTIDSINQTQPSSIQPQNNQGQMTSVIVPPLSSSSSNDNVVGQNNYQNIYRSNQHQSVQRQPSLPATLKQQTSSQSLPVQLQQSASQYNIPHSSSYPYQTIPSNSANPNPHSNHTPQVSVSPSYSNNLTANNIPSVVQFNEMPTPSYNYIASNQSLNPNGHFNVVNNMASMSSRLYPNMASPLNINYMSAQSSSQQVVANGVNNTSSGRIGKTYSMMDSGTNRNIKLDYSKINRLSYEISQNMIIGPPFKYLKPCKESLLEQKPKRSKRKSKFTKEQDELIIRLKNENKSWVEIAELTNVDSYLAARNRYQVLIGQQGGGVSECGPDDVLILKNLLDDGEIEKMKYLTKEFKKCTGKSCNYKQVRELLRYLFWKDPSEFDVDETYLIELKRLKQVRFNEFNSADRYTEEELEAQLAENKENKPESENDKEPLKTSIY